MEKYYLASLGILVVSLLFILFVGLDAKTGYYTKIGSQFFTRQPLSKEMQESVENNYRYGANQGPQGQQYVRSTDKWFIPYKEPAVNPYVRVCCDVVRMAEHGQIRCPETREQAVQSCAVDSEEGSYVFPPCPPNQLQCYLPFKNGKKGYQDEEIIE
ncbi:hypothetical protein HYV79_04190 [Candidatus Woesearchaeota archaeon]|nr:hypothetical protein [Candidatus Woesearchaeota archaeon]